MLTSFRLIAVFKNSLTSLDLPLPASPQINKVFPLPLKVEVNAISRAFNSLALPTKTEFNKPIAQPTIHPVEL